MSNPYPEQPEWWDEWLDEDELDVGDKEDEEDDYFDDEGYYR